MTTPPDKSLQPLDPRSTNKRIIIAVLIVLAVLLFRFVQMTLLETGEGNGAESPNKRFRALAESCYTTRFFGGRHNYYEFTIEASDGRRIQHIVMDEPTQGMIGWREGGSIQWAPDSSSVTYTFKGAQLILSVVP